MTSDMPFNTHIVLIIPPDRPVNIPHVPVHRLYIAVNIPNVSVNVPSRPATFQLQLSRLFTYHLVSFSPRCKVYHTRTVLPKTGN